MRPLVLNYTVSLVTGAVLCSLALCLFVDLSNHNRNCFFFPLNKYFLMKVIHIRTISPLRIKMIWIRLNRLCRLV